ncbi:MAG TPA: zinc ribbon domain-containing protein [Ramlibacter sp.]|uniref:zinc ribbon domain-containing protein n=1 Tax=Ramlibacter sp. TaxID=1917967 RepID=UPI002BC2FF82|nr:zinc ribbon domain-containing protein [Ramlibacter sp.]HVZ46417.1 zinc ribbon domain-containing protein [Ramlibacter sp.]
MFCPSCGAEVAPTAKFCPSCGAAQTPDGEPAPAPARRTSRPSLLLGGAAVLVMAAAAGVYALREVRLQHEIDERRAAEARMQAELKVVRKRAEDVEQALIDAEQEASLARKRQDGAAPFAAAAPTLPARVTRLLDPREAAVARAARASQARRQASERAAQEARERRRAEEAAESARVLPPPPPPPPATSAPIQTARIGPEQMCRTAANFIAKAVCETRECIKPENESTAYCKALRARASPPAQ